MDRPRSWGSQSIDLSAEPPLRIGKATIDPKSREAEFPGGRERLQPQNLKVLIALARHSGHVVTRADLIDLCWDGRIVGDDVINGAISHLRKCLAGAGFTIETIPKSGYRLIATGQLRDRKRVWALAALALAAVAGIIVWVQRNSPTRLEPPTVALMAFTSGADRQSRDVAAASSEALSHMLLAGTFAPRLDWPATAKEQARADFVLSGDVRKISGGLIAVVQLRDRASGTVVFSRQYSIGEAQAAALPERIGAEMSSNVTGALAMLVLDRRRPVDPEIAADFLKQIAMIVQGSDPLDSYQVSRKLAAEHPESALSQLALAFSTGFALGSLPQDQREQAAHRGRIAAAAALRLAPHFGDTYVPWCLLHPQPRLIECENRMRAGMKADTHAPYLPTFFSDVLVSVGRHDEALKVSRAALSDQPYQPHKLRRVALILLMLNRKQDAEDLHARARRWWPEHPNIYGDRLRGYALLGDLDGLRRAASETPDSVADVDRREIDAIGDAWRGRTPAALKAVCAEERLTYLGRLACIGALASTGDKDTAFSVAEVLVPRLVTGSESGDNRTFLEDPYAGIDVVLTAPAMRWLRSDPRYRMLAERVGLLAYWRSGRLPDFCRQRDPEPFCSRIIN